MFAPFHDQAFACSGATGCSREYSSSLSELVASRSNMNKISLKPQFIHKGRSTVLAWAQDYVSPREERQLGGRVGGDCSRHSPSVASLAFAKLPLEVLLPDRK